MASQPAMKSDATRIVPGIAFITFQGIDWAEGNPPNFTQSPVLLRTAIATGHGHALNPGAFPADPQQLAAATIGLFIDIVEMPPSSTGRQAGDPARLAAIHSRES
jgi:hypothetical protein